MLVLRQCRQTTNALFGELQIMNHMPVSTAIQLLEETIFACSDDPRLEEAWGVVLHLMQDYRRVIKEETS